MYQSLLREDLIHITSMKKTITYLIYGILAVVAIWGAFYTENLTERTKREKMAEYKPSELVGVMFGDSLPTLEARAISIRELSDSITDAGFVREHGRLFGIGSPLFFVVKGEMSSPILREDELHGSVDGVEVTIPLKYIFGNTAREASGWFNIDDFKNTPDFNAISAEMNRYIGANVIGDKAERLSADGSLSFLAAVAVPADAERIESLTIIPYVIK